MADGDALEEPVALTLTEPDAVTVCEVDSVTLAVGTLDSVWLADGDID